MADRIKGITIEIGGDTTGLNKALSGVNKEIRGTQSQLKDVERLLKLDPTNTELLKQKQKLLAEAVGETKNKLDTLKEAEKQAQQQFKEGKISEQQYDALKREIIETEQQLKKIEDQAGKSNVALQKIGQAGATIKEVGGKITDVGQKMMAVTGAITAVGAASVAAWNTVDEAYDTIAKGTGATGDALEDLQKSFDNVFSSIPTEAATAGSAIADINTRFGFTGEVLEDCTKKFIQFGEVNNTDVSTAIANVSRYMGDAGIESSKYSEVLDQLTAASQASGLGVDKLSESLTKYGAPMRALGFDTEESIAIFAGWEKAGVNTEIAFSGMKQAIGKWSKEGKDARKEFKKTLKEIKDCPDIAEATGKAIEAFGQKAGPDLADAIQGGRFEYEDFLKVLENSAGQLEQTFNDTLDPIDEVKVAMQGLTSEGAVLGGELLSTLAPMITKLVEKIRELTTWFKGLSDEQKQMVVKIGLIVAAIGPLLIVIGQLATGIGGIMTLVSSLGPAIGALGAVGGPILITVAAVGALAAAITFAKEETKKYYNEAVQLSEQEEINKQKVNELHESYESLNQQRQGATQAVQAQTQHEQTLFKELQSITDENGKVKEGDKERAEFILGQLSSALGTELTMTGDQIDNYKEMCNSIDMLIKKKQANALLAANEAAYAEAIKNQTDAFMAYNNAQKDVTDTKSKLNEAQKKQAEYQEEIKGLMDKGILTWEDYTRQEDELTRKMNECAAAAEGYQEKLTEQEQTLKDAEAAYAGYNATISNYEGLSSAIISGDQQKISDAVLKTANNFQTAENSTKEALVRQLQNFRQQYQEMQNAVDAGAPGVCQAQADNMKRLIELTEQELGILPGTIEKPMRDTVNILESKKAQLGDVGKGLGGDFGSGYAGGISSSSGEVGKAVDAVGKTSIDELKTSIDSHSPSKKTHEIGNDYTGGYAKGIGDGSNQVLSAVDKMADDSLKALSGALKDSQSSTQNYQKTMLSGWTSWASGLSSQIKASLQQIVTTTNSSMSSINSTVSSQTKSAGQAWIQGWKDVQNQHKAIMDTIKTSHTTTMSEIERVNRDKTNKMKEDSTGAYQEMQNSIRTTLSGLLGTVQAGFTPSTNYISGLKNQSPIWGRDMMSGFISGVRGKFSELERACREAANTVSDYMHFTRPEKGPLRYYEEWMPHMMEGFSEGIRANTWRVTDQVRALAATVNDSMTEIQGNSMTQGVSDGQLIGMLTQYLPAIAGQKYVLLDGKALVGYTSAEMDRSLGEMQAMKVRTG